MKEHSTSTTMGAAVLTVLVVCCAIVGVAYGQSFIPSGYSSVDQTKWADVSAKITLHLVGMEDDEGRPFKLAQLQSLASQPVAGFKYVGTAEFEIGEGKIVNCGFSLVLGLTDYEKLQLNCEGKIYSKKPLP